MKRILIVIFCLLCFIMCGCDTNTSDDSAIDTEVNTQSIVQETENESDTTETEIVNEPKGTPSLLHNKVGFSNRYFYVYYLNPLAYDEEHASNMAWEYVAGENEKHNEWIETQTFTSLFRYGGKCIRAGYLNETGQWGVTWFVHSGLYTAYVGMGQSIGTTITYPQDEAWLATPNAFGVPNDHSVEITSFDETKKTVTLTFTSPEGETTEVYINYVEWRRCDENGTLLLNEDGNTFFYQYEGDFYCTQYNELD